ncbi:MAG: hypothetical protein M3336_05015, partial [Chloroflexota bacterium]|nr:hypothetical protein [Chloroflexota bacterium]
MHETDMPAGKALSVTGQAAAARPLTRARGRGGYSMAAQESLIAYLFILPSFVGFVVFLVIPILASLGLSLFDWELLLPPRFVGLQNFSQLLQDQIFRAVVINTAYYAFGLVPLNIVISLGLAVWLNTK